MSNTTSISRRAFVGTCVSAAVGPLLNGNRAKAGSSSDWQAMREDPVRTKIAGAPDLDTILALFPRTTGKPAFDPVLIAENIKKLNPRPAINTGHPFLDLSVKTGLAHIDATFQGDHPKYGVGSYQADQHDGFPPTIIAAVDALSAWGMNERAARLFHYWLSHFVREDGTIIYYGPSISEYGQLLHTAALLEERAGPAGWWDDGHKALDRIAEYLLRSAGRRPEGRWLDLGLAGGGHPQGRRQVFPQQWLGRERPAPVGGFVRTAEVHADHFDRHHTKSQRRSRRGYSSRHPENMARGPEGLVAPARDPRHARSRPCLTANTEASYTNYRYWPELLSSGLLPPALANRVVEARLSAGGQFCGMTRFENHLDDWPLADYLYALWSLGRKSDFLLSLYGHVAYHQAEGHLTAYEQVSFPPGKQVADYCLPCQLVAARAARLLVS